MPTKDFIPKPLASLPDRDSSLPDIRDVKPRELTPRESKIRGAREKGVMISPDGKEWVPFSKFKYIKNPSTNQWEPSSEEREEYGSEEGYI